MQSLLEELLRYRAALTVQEELGRLCKAHLPSSSSSHARGLLPSAIFEGHQSLAVTTSNPPGVRDTECVQRTRRWVHPIIDVRRQAEVVEVPEVMPIGAGRLRLVAMQYDQGDIRGVVEPLETTDDAAATTSAQLQRSVSIKNLRLAIPEPFYHDALLPALEAIEPHHASKNVLDLCLNKLCGAANKMDTSFNQKRKRAWQLTDEVTYIFYVARKQLAQRREAVQMQKYNGGEERPWELKVYLESGDARLLGVLESAPPSGGIGGSGRTAIVIDLVRGVESSSEWVRLRDWLVPSASSCSDTVPCQEQYDVEWTVLSDAALRFRIPIGADVVLRLHARYTAQRPVAAPTTTKLLFLHALARLLLRYHGLSGGRMEKESGWQAAVPPSVIDVFEHHHQGLLSTQRPTVIAECFSSPFNATRSFFFSVFHDTDADFGSLGNFFGCCDAAACIAAVNAAERSSCGAVEDVASPARCPTSGGGGSGGGDVSTTASVSNSHHLLRLECNPPFDHEVIAAAFSHLLKWLENASLTIAVSILIIIPDSKQVHAAQVRATIEQSRFCRWVRSLPPRECLYVHGAHYQDPSASDGPIAHLKFRKRPRETVSEATNSSCLAAVANSLVRLSCPSRLMVIQDDKAEQACPGSEIGAEVVAAWSQLSNRVYSSAR
ncbi:hypothetical protein JKF63_00830 [Porcisia hertigi]|uniref:PCIF1 WW domain-containing protein n=1 Tax=Porcisia hertigi TaxID=2761500 RepID=A0A836IAA4_9TRYP|nr:hypothetical protein JKF63_00830 [Porcisia hertigi]